MNDLFLAGGVVAVVVIALIIYEATKNPKYGEWKGNGYVFNIEPVSGTNVMKFHLHDTIHSNLFAYTVPKWQQNRSGMVMKPFKNNGKTIHQSLTLNYIPSSKELNVTWGLQTADMRNTLANKS